MYLEDHLATAIALLRNLLAPVVLHLVNPAFLLQLLSPHPEQYVSYVISLALEHPESLVVLQVPTTAPVHILVVDVLHMMNHLVGKTAENVLRMPSVDEYHDFLLIRVVVTGLYLHSRSVLYFIVKFNLWPGIDFIAFIFEPVKIRLYIFVKVCIVHFAFAHHSTDSSVPATASVTHHMGIAKVTLRR